MTHVAFESDQALWQSLRTRRRKAEQLRGLDASAARWKARIAHARKDVSYLRKQANLVAAQAEQWHVLSEKALDERIAELRGYFATGKLTPEQQCAGLAAVREAARREVGQEPYPVQMMGALGMYHGQIVEMVTGEGKTLTGAIAAVMLAWRHRQVHVVTVNDYLAKRDVELQQPIYKRCGQTAAAIEAETDPEVRYVNYRRQIVYLTQKELVADWLRDQLRLGRITDPVAMRWRAYEAEGMPPQVLIPGLRSAIVDEADAVLIDEAVTPLIIAQERNDAAQADMYHRARTIALSLTQGRHYTVEYKKRQVELTRAGSKAVGDAILENDHAIWRTRRRRDELVEQALVAEHCYLEGEQYQLLDEKIVIVDEYTGRFMQDRQWQHGLHQAVEAKHDVEVTADKDTLASMSFQRYFLQYPLLSGMTGTAADAKAEMETTYRAPVRVIPTHRPIVRERYKTMIYASAERKWLAVIEEIKAMHKAGRPVLAGTRSVAASQILSRLLDQAGLEHAVLNAVNHEVEAAVVARAGERGAVTVATNMAGRGTDIKLGKGVKEAGGLHVILTELHTASRIDRQFIGRAGRQGDPGSARAIICLEDDLIIKHAPRRGAWLRKRYSGREKPLPRRLLRLFLRCQQKTQNQAFQSRRQVLRRDEELDKALP